MVIDRTRALLLVGALSSAAGCTVNDDSGDTGGGQTGSGGATTQTGGAAGAAGQTAGGGGLAGTAGANEAGAGASHAGSGGAATGGSNAAGTSGNAGSGGAAAGAGNAGGGSGGAACLGDTGTPADCTPVQSIGSCGDFGLAYCGSAIANFRAGVAEQAVTCMLGLTDTCGPPYDCVKSALGQACSDSTADTLCVDVLATCTSDISTAAQCHALVDGLDATGRAAVVTCVEGGCTDGLWSCLESL